MEQPCPPTVYLMVNHALRGVAGHSLYKFELPLDLSDYDQMIDSDGFMADSKNISPVLALKDINFMPLCTSVPLGSKIYFFGGVHTFVKDKRLHDKVEFFDTERPERGLQAVAPLTRPKMCPCSFAADGMIYALGAFLGPTMYERKPLPGCKGSGYFERYDPSLDQWQVLPDPPFSNINWAGAHFGDRATVVGRRVFIGSPYLYAVFNLDVQDWEQLPLPPLQNGRFHCASSFVQEQDSVFLYCLERPVKFEGPAQVIKKGPLPLPTTGMDHGDYVRNLMSSPAFDPAKGQVVAEGTDLDDMFFAHTNFRPFRSLHHMGGRFFCYVASAQLADFCDDTHHEPNSRGVWIRFLEDVSAKPDTHGCNKFRTLATFCYKLNTDFSNRAIFIRCHVLGTVPDSWIKAPLEKRLVIKLKKPKKTPTQQRYAEHREAMDDKKRLITLEEENRRLVAELVEAKERVKSLEKSISKSIE